MRRRGGGLDLLNPDVGINGKWPLALGLVLDLAVFSWLRKVWPKGKQTIDGWSLLTNASPWGYGAAALWYWSQGTLTSSLFTGASNFAIGELIGQVPFLSGLSGLTLSIPTLGAIAGTVWAMQGWAWAVAQGLRIVNRVAARAGWGITRESALMKMRRNEETAK